MTYQGYLVDANGTALGNSAPKNYDVVFRIYDDQSAGNNLWAEQQTLTVDKGYFSVLLGEGSQVGSEPRPALSSLFASATASDRFVEITVKGIGSGGADSTILPRLRLLTSPYAFLAQRALNLQGSVNTASGLTLNGLTTVSNLSVIRNLILDSNGQNSGSVSNFAVTFGSPSGEGIASKRTSGGNQNGLDFYTAFQTRMSIDNGGNVGILGTKVLEFGRGIAGKESNAGKIGYNTWSGDALDIVGAGTNSNASDRKIRLYCDGGVTASGTVTAPAFSGNGTIPVGGIIMWSGATNNIPSGWALCNGQTVNSQTTPNLQDRFIVGAGSYAVKATGGAQTVTLSVPNLPIHSHPYTDYFFHEHSSNWSSGGNASPGDGTGDNQSTTRTTGNTGSGQAFDIRPPYYALAFIMRVY
jgi:microcystin-dependent protein